MNPASPPLLSIILPCYNHGEYLAHAIESVLQLNYPRVEILVVDDGSTDQTRQVCTLYPHVKYIYQPNQGLPAARNTGIAHATGEFVSFLDADDWYYHNGLPANLDILRQHPEAAFISGCHDIVFPDGWILEHCRRDIQGDHYLHLLRGNFIGNPSVVIYRSRVLKEIPFATDAGLKGCEDYDHYLHIARKYPVLHNPVSISAYRKHESNMSNNYAMMLNAALTALVRQKPLLRTPKEREAWQEGWRAWEIFYGWFPLYTDGKIRFTRPHWELLKKYNLKLPFKLWEKLRHTVKIGHKRNA